MVPVSLTPTWIKSQNIFFFHIHDNIFKLKFLNSFLILIFKIPPGTDGLCFIAIVVVSIIRKACDVIYSGRYIAFMYPNEKGEGVHVYQCIQFRRCWSISRSGSLPTRGYSASYKFSIASRKKETKTVHWIGIVDANIKSRYINDWRHSVFNLDYLRKTDLNNCS